MKKIHFLTELNRRRFFALQKGVYGGYFTGQLGKTVVGATIFGKKSLRTYAKPSNPNTVDQQSVRSKFKISQVVASTILASIIHPYWNPFANGQSGFNSFIGHNSQIVGDANDFIDIQTMKGSYEPIKSITSAVYTPGTGVIDVVFDPTVQNIGNANDRIISVFIDTTYYDPAQKTPILLVEIVDDKIRSDAADDAQMLVGKTPADFFVFLATIQPITDKILKIGTSKSLICS